MHKQGTWLLSLCVATGLVGRGLAQEPALPAADAPPPVWPESGPALAPAAEAAAPATPSLPDPAPTMLPEPALPMSAPETIATPVALPEIKPVEPSAPVAEAAPAAPASVEAAPVAVTPPAPAAEAAPVAAVPTLPEAVPAVSGDVKTEASLPVPTLPEATTTAAAPEALPELPALPALDLTPSPVTHLPPPAQVAPAKVAGNPYGQLRQARELYGLHRYEEAEAIARRLLPMQVTWAAMNDSPRKLLEDVGRARVHATQDGASLVLSEGRRALQQGNIDEAERLVQVAELIRGPQRWFATDDSPSKLMADIRGARAARGDNPMLEQPGAPTTVQPATTLGAPMPVGAAMPVGAVQPDRRSGIVGRIAARFNTTPATPEATPTVTPEMLTPVTQTPAGAVVMPAEPVVKTRANTPRLNNFKERIANLGNGSRPGALPPPSTQVVVMPGTALPAATPPPALLPNELAAQPAANPAVVQTGAVGQEPEVLKNSPTVVVPSAPPVVVVTPMPAPAAVVETAPVPVVQTPPPPVAPPEAPANPQFLQTPQMADPSTPMPISTTAPEPIAAPRPPVAPVAMPAAPCAACATGECATCAPSSKSLPFCLAGNVGFSLMRPYFKSNPAAFAGVPGALNVGREIEFGLGTQFVPELSIGLISTNNIGFRTNWWGFATSDRQAVAGPPFLATAAPLGLGLATGTPGGALVSRAALRMNVWDVEVVRDYCGDSWAVLVAGGLRYTHTNQRYDADLRLASGAVETLRSGHNFNGFGPTVFARGRRGVGNGLYFYGEGRASLLFGRTVQDATALTVDDDLNGGMTSRMVMPVGEVAGGVGWRRDFDGMEVFAETGLVGQVWVEAGNSSRSVGATTLAVGGVGAPSVADHNLGLLGFTMRVGLNY